MLTYHKKFNDWQQYANQSLSWFSTDSEKTFQYNLKNKYSLLEQNGYLDKNIEYKFNSHGFRCNEFTKEDSIIFLGCSITQGVGVSNDETFAHTVANKLNLKCCNLGQQGKSSDTGFRILLNYIDKLNIKILVTYFPMIHRFELLTDDTAIDFVLHKQYDDSYLNEYYKTYNSASENAYLNSLKNILAMRQLCNERFIKFIDVSNDRLDAGLDSNSPELARDLSHPGPFGHQCRHKLILDKI